MDPRTARLACGPALLLTAWMANGLGVGFGDADIHAVLADPSAFPRDLLTLAERHPSVLWPAVRAGAGASWVAAAICLLATGWSAGALAAELAPRRPASWIAAAATAGVSWGALGGAPTIDPVFVPRLAALPIELAAIVLALRGRWPLAFTVAGATLCVHAPSGVATCLLVGGVWWPSRRTAWWAPGMTGLGAGLAIALVGEFGAASFDPEIWSLVRARLAHHVDPGSWGGWTWGQGALWSGAALLLAPPRLRGGLGWMLAGAAALGLASLGGSALLVNLEPWQATRFAVLVVAIALPVRLRGRWRVAPLLLALLLSPERHEDGPLESRQRALAAWAAEHTAPSDLFILPPHLPPAFRARAQRPVFGTWKDGGEAQFSPPLAREWARRMEALCACALFAGPPPPESHPYARSRALARRLGDGFTSQTVADLTALARAEGARYLVLDRPVPHAVDVAGFAVIDLGAPDSERRGGSRLSDPEVR